MSRRCLALAAVLILSFSFLLTGCIRRPRVERVASFRLTDSVVCLKPSYAVDTLPKSQATQLKTSEEQVVMWLRFKDIKKAHALVWKWYDPDGELYFETYPHTVNREGNYHEAVMAWHRIRIAGEKASTLPGIWRVVVFLDGESLTSRTFRVVP